LLKPWFSKVARHLPVIALVCFGLFVSVTAFVTFRTLESEKAQEAFQRVAMARVDDLQDDLDSADSKVGALGAFCSTSNPVTRSSFDSFATPLFNEHNHGILALEWVPRVSLSERAAFEDSARASGLHGYEIRERDAQRRMGRSGDRPYYFPILYVQPQLANQAAVGFDVYSSSKRRSAIERAESSGATTATQWLNLVQDGSGQHGIAIFRPVYRSSGGSIQPKQLLGFAVGVLRISDIVEQHGVQSGVDIAIFDSSANPGEQELYPSGGKRPQPASPFTQYRTIVVGDRRWQVIASPIPGAFRVNKTYSFAGAALSLLFTLLVALHVGTNLSRRRRVEQVVDERTSDLNCALRSLASVHRGLEESEARYRGLVQDSPSAVVVEREGKIVLVNRACVVMFGFDPTLSSEDHAMVDFVVPERREIAKALFRELYSKDTQLPPRETRVMRRDGSIVDAEIAASSFMHEGVRSIQVVLRDISQRKLAEAENARLVRAIEQVEESIVITDLDANIVYVNPAFERISGYSREEVLGINPRVLNSGRQDGKFYASIWQLLKSGESWSGRFINRRKNGHLFSEEATISPVVNRSGAIINYVAVKRDVTLEDELQEQLNQSQKMDAIGRLAGGVAHDFNNMLMVIVSYAELIENRLSEDDPLRSHIAQITSAAQRSATLTRQLLAFGRKQVLTPQILDLNAIVLETSSMVRRLISENIVLRCDLSPDLWPVKADADQIVQVILNLCVNSRDAMPNGGTLIVTTRNYQVDLGFAELSVSDTGVGIPPELHEKLFEPFFTTKERGKGTGLGLATVYGIVQQSGGRIRVESSPDKGATFTIHLPRCLESASAPEGPTRRSVPSARCRVLLVEDEDALRKAIALQLSSHGYNVLTAAHGVEALDVLSRNRDIAVLITDLIMPRMGGRELASLALTEFPKLQIVFMSGYSGEDFSDCHAAHLQKPFDMRDLLGRLAELGRHPEMTFIEGARTD
jgi:two-component system cell cycle sensor histidine kinase/response regulator CckA